MVAGKGHEDLTLALTQKVEEHGPVFLVAVIVFHVRSVAVSVLLVSSVC